MHTHDERPHRRAHREHPHKRTHDEHPHMHTHGEHPCMHTYGEHRHRKRGAVGALFVVSLPVILGFAALTIDVGHLFATRAQLQAAADAIVLAAVSQLPDGDATLAMAQQVASLNSDGHGAILATTDLIPGQWDTATGTFTAWATPPDAVRATVRRSETNGNPVQLFFARIFGFNTSNVHASAVARGVAPASLDVVPIALPVPDFGPVDPDIADANPGKDGPSEPANGEYFEVGEEVTIFTFGKGPRQPVHLTLEPADTSGVSDMNALLEGQFNGDESPSNVSIGDELNVWGEGTGSGNFGVKLVDRLEDMDPDNDTIIVPIVEETETSRDENGDLSGVVRVVDFIAIRLLEVREIDVTDPDDPTKTIEVTILVARVVRVDVEAGGNGMASDAIRYTDGSVVTAPHLVM